MKNQHCSSATKDTMAKVEENRVTVRFLAAELTNAVLSHNFEEGLGVLKKLAHLEPPKPYALYIVRIANKLADELSSTHPEQSLACLQLSQRLALLTEDKPALCQTISIMIKNFLKLRDWEKAKDCATLLGTYDSPFHEWSIKLKIAMSSKCSQDIAESIEHCLSLDATTTLDVKTIMKQVADRGNIFALNALLSKMKEFSPKNNSCIEIAELYCLNVMLSVKFNLKDNLVDAFSRYVSYYCRLNANERCDISHFHDKITDCTELKIEWILSMSASASRNDCKTALDLCTVLVFLYDFVKKNECLIYALSLQTKLLVLSEGVEIARKNLFNALKRKKMQSEDAPLLRKLLIDLEIVPTMREFNFSESNLLSHGKCLEQLLKTTLSPQDMIVKLGDLADLISSDCGLLDDLKTLLFDVIFRLAAKMWCDHPDRKTEEFLCQVASQLSTILSRQTLAEEERSTAKVIWLSQGLWNIALGSTLKTTPCILFRLAAEMLPSDDNTRLTCRVAQLGAILDCKNPPEDQLVAALEEISGALRCCEDDEFKRKLSVLLLKGILLLKNADVSQIVSEAICDADLMTLEMFAALLSAYPVWQDVQIQLLRMSITLARGKDDAALMRNALVLIRLLLTRSPDCERIADVIPDIMSVNTNGRSNSSLNDDQIQLLALLIIIDLWNSSTKLIHSGGGLRGKALQLRDMATSLVDLAPRYRLFFKGKIVRG